jgi:hypothetical protein
MSIDWLMDLDRDIENGKEIYACAGSGKNQWVFKKNAEELKKIAQRTAETTKLPVNIVRVVSKNEAVAGDLFLCPIQIGDPGARGEPNVQWRPIESKESAENMKDVRKGPAPVFAMQVQETIQPPASA